MKKVLLSVIIVFALIGIASTSTYAVTEQNVLSSETTSQLIELKDKTIQELSDYEELYGSKAFGYTAFILNKIRIFSIPLCFIGIAIGSIFQYVIGIRRYDLRETGFKTIVTVVTILVICQVMPLIFAIVVHGWRG